MKKRKKLTEYRKTFLQCERLWKDIARIRYGAECQVQKHYPNINIAHSNVLQIDHVISRRDKNLFFHVFNGIPVCATCNRAKCFNQKGIAHAIEQIVINKIGGENFGQMMDVHMTHPPNHNWKKVWYIEKVFEELKNHQRYLRTNKANF